MHIAVIAGPLDGVESSRGSGGVALGRPFVFLDERGRRFATPAAGRHLYRLAAWVLEAGSMTQVYLYAGFTHRRCGHCGGVYCTLGGHSRQCPLCPRAPESVTR
jgi:hypothetical protein